MENNGTKQQNSREYCSGRQFNRKGRMKEKKDLEQSPAWFDTVKKSGERRQNTIFSIISDQRHNDSIWKSLFSIYSIFKLIQFEG